MKRRPISHFDDAVEYVREMFAEGVPVAADDPLPSGKRLEDALRELVARVDRAGLDDNGRATVAAAREIVRLWDTGYALVPGGSPVGGGTVADAFAATRGAA